MARKLTAPEVIAAVNALKDDTGMTKLRESIRNNHQLHDGKFDPALPAHMTTTGVAFMNSKRLQKAMQDLNAFMSGYPTTLTVYPANPTSDQKKADRAEERLAVLRADLFSDAVSVETMWHLGISGPAINKLVCYEPGAARQWGVDVPDILSCYYPNPREVPSRLPVFAREYQMLGSKIMELYGKDRAKQGSKLTNNAGKWGLEPISRETAPGEGDEPTATGLEDFGPYEIKEYDDGHCTYIVAMNRGKAQNPASGEIVWQYEHRTKTPGSLYVIGAGALTGASQPAGRLLPYWNAYMQVLSQINFLRACIATAGVAQRVQVMVDRNPEFLKGAVDADFLKELTNVDAEARDIMYYNGRPYQVEFPTNEALVAMLTEANAELQRLEDSELSVTTSEVVSQATRGGVQLAVGQREKQKTLLLKTKDRMQQIIMKMVIETIASEEGEDGYMPDDPDEGWGYYAMGSVSHGKGEVKAGTRLTLKPEDVTGFKYEVDITTAAKSDEQRQAAFEAAVMAIQVGLGTTDEALEAKGITDIAGWYEKKNKDDAYKAAGQLFDANIYVQTAIEKLRLRGILLQNPMAPAPQMTQAPVNPAQGAPPPQTEGAVGGSSPAMPI